MQDILAEPVELIDNDLDEVAGGNPFSVSTNSGKFAIGAVFGNSSSAPFGIFSGEVIHQNILFLIINL